MKEIKHEIAKLAGSLRDTLELLSNIGLLLNGQVVYIFIARRGVDRRERIHKCTLFFFFIWNISILFNERMII